MSKTPKRVVRVTLPVELCEALEEMGNSSTIGGFIPAPRKLCNTIETSLKWAVWSWSHGRGPDFEMLEDCRGGQPASDTSGYTKWDEKFRERRELKELETLYRLGESPDSQPES